MIISLLAIPPLRRPASLFENLQGFLAQLPLQIGPARLQPLEAFSARMADSFITLDNFCPAD